ncbi:hypothetical protein [Rhizobium sp.]|uniref:hypothetical protein n=1 Tax=Rhizobium sp. TaxID=391 RepID=UPI003F80830E
MNSQSLKVDRVRPIADGILFDDTHGFTSKQVRLLNARKVLFTTKFRDEDGDRWLSGVIIASDIDAAKAVAFGRGLNEEVIANAAWPVPQSGDEQ